MLSTPTLNVMWISFFPTGIRTVCPLSTPARQHQSMSEVNLHFHITSLNNCLLVSWPNQRHTLSVSVSLSHPSLSPAGTGTVTVCLCLVCPEPRHITQGVVTMEPRPPQRRHVERIMKGPVFIDSYRGQHRDQH